MPKMLQTAKDRGYLLSAFFFGYLGHLLEDMPTPASVWGGVNLFFPSSGYVGGFGQIWWWNNYDLVLIIVAVITINFLINCIPKITAKARSIAAVVVFVFGLSIFLIQVHTRPVTFAYEGHTPNYKQLEQRSKDIQRDTQ